MNWRLSIFEDIHKPGEILYPKNFKPEGLIFQSMHISSLERDPTGNTTNLKVFELNIDKNEVHFPSELEKDLDGIKNHYVNYGFVEKKEDVNFVVARIDPSRANHLTSDYALFFVSLPAEKISFKRAFELEKQFIKFHEIEELLPKILDENIETDKGTLSLIKPQSPTSPVFARLLLDKEHYEIFSNLKHASSYTISQNEIKGDYPPISFHRFMLDQATSLAATTSTGEVVSTEKRPYSKKAYTSEAKKIRGAFNKLMGLQDDISIAEVILDGRELDKLKEDLLALKAERALEDLANNNTNRAKELLRRFNSRGDSERLK